MAIGDLVKLSKTGEKVSCYMDIKDMTKYGLVVGYDFWLNRLWIRWFKHDGTPLLKTIMNRRDLKKLNKA